MIRLAFICPTCFSCVFGRSISKIARNHIEGVANLITIVPIYVGKRGGKLHTKGIGQGD